MSKRQRSDPTRGAAPHPAKYQRVNADKEKRVSHKVHRVRTDKLTRDAASGSLMEPDTIERQVHDVLLDRLQQAQIPLNDTTIASLGFLWPRNHPELWLKLLNHPLTMTDSEVANILELEESTPQTSDPVRGDQLYYMRTFKLRVRDLRCIVDKWYQDSLHSEQCTAWWNAVRLIKDDRQSVYIRYIGTSTVVSAYERYSADVSIRKRGLYAHFCALLRERYPTAYEACTVHTFSDAQVQSFGHTNGILFRVHGNLTDIREQALIAIFDQCLLLNRQVGGFTVAYQPPQKDIMRFGALGTRVVDKFRPDRTFGYAKPTAKTIANVQAWMHDVAELSNAHPVELGTDKMPITRSMMRAWAEQAIPCTFYGKVVAVFIGDYCPINAMKNPGPFWKQDCRAAKYLKDILARLLANESGRTHWKPEELNVIAENNILPWVDYQYTTKRDDFRWESAELMRQYLDAVRPLIVPSFEKNASSILHKEFGALYRHDFHPFVGEPAIRHYTHRGKIYNQGNRASCTEWPFDPEDCFIHIPSIHPGADRYDYGVSEMRRFLDMTQWQVILMIECALDVLREGFLGPRSQLCDKILRSFAERWTKSGNAAIFADAKRDLMTFYAEKPSVYTHDSLRQYKTDWNGSEVNINLQGIISVYWMRPDGTKKVAKMFGGTKTNVHPPKDAEGFDAVRTIHFLPSGGIDIRDYQGKSCVYRLYRRTFTNPTFPGEALRIKIAEPGVTDMIGLWEHETGLEFDTIVPEDAPIPGAACQACASTKSTCGDDRPCARCVARGYNCKPQLLSNRIRYGDPVDDDVYG